MTPWTVAQQAPLSLGFPRQEYWNGVPFPSLRDLPDPRIKLTSPALQADSLFAEPPWRAQNQLYIYIYIYIYTVCVLNCLQSCPTLCSPRDCSPPCSSVLGSLQRKSTEVGCHALLQGIFLPQGSNPCLFHLVHWQAGSLPPASPSKP